MHLWREIFNKMIQTNFREAKPLKNRKKTKKIVRAKEWNKVDMVSHIFVECARY